MRNVTIMLFLILLLLAGIIALQLFLSRRESRWPGLILPLITFLFGLLYPLNLIVPPDGVTAGFVMQAVVVWLLGNVPTFVFLAIYLACREKKRRRKQLDKMNIQDLH